jgi:hypothetical protein
MAYALRDINNRKYPVNMRLQIGSDPSNQIILLDPQVFPVHATLWEQQGNLYLQDGSGGSATFVNQVIIQGTVNLRMGDRVTIGGTLFTVDDPNAQPVVPAQASKKRIGCISWLLIGFVMFLVECLLITAFGFFIYTSDMEIQASLIDLQQLLVSSPQTDTKVPPSGTDIPGPTILDLKDTWLGTNFTQSFSQHNGWAVKGLSLTGTTFTTSFVFDIMQQGTPEWISYALSKQIVNGAVIAQSESGIVNKTIYSGSATCKSSADPKGEIHVFDGTPQNILTNELTGHVKLIETGVTINGIITDRYQLRRDNFIALDTLVEFISGSLYRARDGGYLIQLDYVVKIKPQSWAINMSDDYSTTEPSQVAYHFDRTYAPDGTLSPKVPKVCAGQVK